LIYSLDFISNNKSKASNWNWISAKGTKIKARIEIRVWIIPPTSPNTSHIL
jgi:hypothetical protein